MPQHTFVRKILAIGSGSFASVVRAVLCAVLCGCLGSCETFHFGDKIRLRGAVAPVLHLEEIGKPWTPWTELETYIPTELYELDGNLYERSTLSWCPYEHLAAWYRRLTGMGDLVYNHSSEEKLGAPLEQEVVYIYCGQTDDHASAAGDEKPIIRAADFDIARARRISGDEVRSRDGQGGYEFDWFMSPAYRHPVFRFQRINYADIHTHLANLPDRGVHPLNAVAGRLVWLMVDLPLDVIVNIINPLDLWHYPESCQ